MNYEYIFYLLKPSGLPALQWTPSCYAKLFNHVQAAHYVDGKG